MLWKMAAVLLSLGLDNLLLSTAMGTSKLKHRLRLCLLFALFEGLMPAIGFVAGQTVASWIGQWAFYVGILGLLGLGVYILFEEDDDDDKISESIKGWALIGAAVSVSLDELAVGFSFGMLRFPLWATLILLAVQAFLFTYVGLAFGSKIRPYLGRSAEKLAGVALMIAAVILAIEHWFTT